MALQVKPPLGMPLSHAEVLFPAPLPPIPRHLPANVLRQIANGSPGVPITQGRDLNGVPGSCFQRT